MCKERTFNNYRLGNRISLLLGIFSLSGSPVRDSPRCVSGLSPNEQRLVITQLSNRFEAILSADVTQQFATIEQHIFRF
jgi:hypothetical protein